MAVKHDMQGHHGAGRELSQHAKGIKSWLTTLDHKRIGIMYLWCGADRFFLSAASSRCWSGIELLTPKQTIMTAETYNQFFTLHGAVMVFLFIIPSIPAALGNFVLP